MKSLELLVTLWPTFPHFEKFARDYRLAGIRLNTAMIKSNEMGEELKNAHDMENRIPLYFDIKGRQLRVAQVVPNSKNLEILLNHPISMTTPSGVLFKAGEDYALLDKVVDGNHLIFKGGPHYMVYEGESICIRDPNLKVNGPLFLDYEIEKIKKAKEAGFTKYFLSYVESQRDIDEFREHVGDAEIIAKIENKKGLEFVANNYKKQKNLSIMAARGDLYVEVDKPHEILGALKMIIEKDPDAYIGSRMLLSAIHSPVPSAADLSELAWLYDLGYRKYLLCDELCLKDNMLSTAVNVFESFKDYYPELSQERKKEAAIIEKVNSDPKYASGVPGGTASKKPSFFRMPKIWGR